MLTLACNMAMSNAIQSMAKSPPQLSFDLMTVCPMFAFCFASNSNSIFISISIEHFTLCRLQASEIQKLGLRVWQSADQPK
ncbi:GM24855 [Drosophila sechellia]|uniref:GM24855 n=1 Tax=Drosophila sechellia TaxID=7238 RepID=B4HL66_DROSE|nr:GM24855 [Drosophila sechellia]